MRRLWWIFFGLVVILLVAAGSVLWVAQSGWLRERIRASIIAQTEKASGGRVELGAIGIDWRGLNATLDRFVIHGSEAAGEAPLLSVNRLLVHLRVTSLLRRDIGVAGIEADRPQVHLIVRGDGTTNLPHPKLAGKASVPERILDLKVATFVVRDGMFTIESAGSVPRNVPWNARGENLAAAVSFDPARARYAGNISLGALHVGPLDLQIGAEAALERDRLVVSRAVLKSAGSAVELKDAVVGSFTSPSLTAHYQAHVSVGEVARFVPAQYKPTGTIVSTGDLIFRSASDYSVKGDLHGSEINVAKLRNLRIGGLLDANPERVSLSDVRLGLLGGEFEGALEWRGPDKVRASGRLAHFDLDELARLETPRPLPYDGFISGPFEASGRLADFSVAAHLSVSPALRGPPVRGEIAVHYDSAAARVNLGDSWLELPHTRIDATGLPGERLNVKLQSTDYKDLGPALDIVTGGNTPVIRFGSFAFVGVVSGILVNPIISGRTTVSDGQFGDYRLQSFSGDITASKTSATASHADLVYEDIHARGAGSVQLNDWALTPASPLTATVDVSESNLANLLARVGHKEVAISGALSANGRITGTVGSPLADADVELTRGLIQGQPFDSISGRLQVTNRSSQALTGLFVSGPKRVNITARFEHTGAQFPSGTLDFNLTSNTMPLNQIALVRQRQPDIHGFGKFHADGALKISHDAKHEIQFSLTSLNADASANGLELGGRNLGDARFIAQTKDDLLTGRFDSNAANASIHGEGTVQLTGDYPSQGKVTFMNAGLNSLAALIVKADDAKSLSFDGTAEGQIDFRGPALKPAQMAASFDIPRIEVHALPGTQLADALPKFVIVNSGPLRATLANSSIRVDSAHFKAPETDVTMDGTIALTQQAPLNLRVQGTVNLALARTLNADLTSTGSIALNATIRGAWQTPDFSGRATIHNGDFHYADFANGLTAANGEVIFSGTRATIQTFTAQSGGGKVDATGFAALTNGVLSFRLEAQARSVRVRYPEGISSVSDAALTFAGTSQRSETSGVITVHRVTINPKSDAATILANAVGPAQTAAAQTGLAANMNLDVQISTARDVALQTSVTESLQADANLRLRGTATNPALLGRINITQGEMVFFGNKYSINTGSISFYNPGKIDPILNIDLETKARGVDVILTVSGPITKLNVSYRSDPPLQFSDIVALLATGRAPSDSTLAIHDTGQSQNFQQLGASALIGQALANPVAGRLQRFFGVSRLKIDPSLTGITGSPEARLTIEQQVTPEILFTYITDVSSTSTQLIRVEWSFNRHWSAILIREENGYVGLDFAYKKRFK